MEHNPEENVYFMATQTDKPPDSKRNKLSRVSIAGIVIAAIIALLVYFLVINKRNQSTASTQGDSSITI